MVDNNIEPLANLLIRSLRKGQEAQYNRLLIKFLDMLDAHLKVSYEVIPKGIMNMINKMLAAQQRFDLLCLADIIQFELLPTMNNKKG